MFKKIWIKIKESFQTALVAAFIVLVVILLLYVPFKIIPQLITKGTSYVSTTLSSMFISGENDNSNNNNDNVTNKPIKTTGSKNTSNNSNTIKYYGYADLSITLLSVGVISDNGIFYPTNTVGKNDNIGVKFQIENIGTNISGVWRLKIDMPSKTTPTYLSDYQISLRPGDRIEYTASFENPTKNGVINGYITADYLNNVRESNKTNNYLTIPIEVTNNSHNYNYSDDLEISCNSKPDNPKVGQVVTWYATVTGGYGQFLYSWQGSDGLLSIQSTANGVKKIYDTTGTKTAKVTINYNGLTYSEDCDDIRVK